MIKSETKQEQKNTLGILEVDYEKEIAGYPFIGVHMRQHDCLRQQGMRLPWLQRQGSKGAGILRRASRNKGRPS
jgi:hypothetical protein